MAIVPRVRRRTGVTLVEVLVVVAILAILIGLVLPAIQKLRNAAARTQCASNVRQLGLAVHACQGTYNVLPPAGARGNQYDAPVEDGVFKGSVGAFFFYLLPFLDQGEFYSGLAGSVLNEYDGKAGHGQVLRCLRCPSDGTGGGRTGLGSPAGHDATWAISNYGCNYLVFGNPAANDQEGQSTLTGTFQNGASNTVIFGERYAWYGSTPTSSLWANSGPPWRAQICCAIDNGGTGYAPCPPFQVQPAVADANGAWSGGQTPHGGVMVTGLGDGSVRLISGAISPANWADACDPRGTTVPEGD